MAEASSGSQVGQGGKGLTDAFSTARNVLTTRAQPSQVTVLVIVAVEANTVLVPSVGNANSGCTVVQFGWTAALDVTTKRRRKRKLTREAKPYEIPMSKELKI